MPLQHYDEAFARIEREIFPKYGLRTNDDGNRVIIIGSRPLVAFDFTYDAKKLSLADKQKAMGEMMRVVAEYGGAGAGCHAIGLLLRDHFGIEHDPVRFAVMREMKKLFDPHNILNPGKKFIA
jgi:FAD/FMN-containing dehydrogenase